MDKETQSVIELCERTIELCGKYANVQAERELERIKMDKSKTIIHAITLLLIVLSLSIVIFLNQKAWIDYLSGSEIVTEYTITEQDGEGVNIIGEGNSVDGTESNNDQENNQAKDKQVK